jgi:hypothetical protein
MSPLRATVLALLGLSAVTFGRGRRNGPGPRGRGRRNGPGAVAATGRPGFGAGSTTALVDPDADAPEAVRG